MATQTIRTNVESNWTVADLHRLFGPIGFGRIRQDPAPGTATEEDVSEIQRREERLYELVDGVLVEKVMGYYESLIAAELIALLRNDVKPKKLGLVAGEAGMVRLSPGLVRIPDVSFVSRDRLPGRRVPREAVPPVVPDLAVEILSQGNTKEEMDLKLRDYFRAGVRLVWFVDPTKRTVKVYTSVRRPRLVKADDVLDGGEVLPGFSVVVRDLFVDLADEGR